jgi:prevent-host-death family protein
MRTVSALTLRKKLGEILDAASAGERIVIERDRHPVAVLVSYEDAQRLEESREERLQRSRAALDRLEALAQQMAREKPWPEGLDSVALVRRERARQDQ